MLITADLDVLGAMVLKQQIISSYLIVG